MGQIREVHIKKNVVERPLKPWTPTVHALLNHLHDLGLPVPEPLDFGGGVERVTFVSGKAGSDAWAHQLNVESVRDPTELRSRGFDETLDRRARIAAFLDGYGWDGPLDVVEAVTARQQTAIDEVVYLGALGHHPQTEWVAAGWPDRWRSKLTTARRVGEKLGL